MKRAKKEVLGLSVIAIVIFVVIFAMLGAGIFLVNIIREDILNARHLIDNRELDRPPTADEPLTVSNRILLSSTNGTEESVGFYNRATNKVKNVAIGISFCTPTGDGEIGDNDNYADHSIKVSSNSTDVGRVEAKDFLIYIDAVSDAWAGGETYICTMVAYNRSGNEPPYSEDAEIYERSSFYLDVLE